MLQTGKSALIKIMCGNTYRVNKITVKEREIEKEMLSYITFMTDE